MELEFDNPMYWIVTIGATLIMSIILWRPGSSWYNMDMATRVIITLGTPVSAFLICHTDGLRKR